MLKEQEGGEEKTQGLATCVLGNFYLFIPCWLPISTDSDDRYLLRYSVDGG